MSGYDKLLVGSIYFLSLYSVINSLFSIIQYSTIRGVFSMQVYYLSTQTPPTSSPRVDPGSIILPYFGKRKQVTQMTFLAKEQNVSVISTDVNGIA